MGTSARVVDALFGVATFSFADAFLFTLTFTFNFLIIITYLTEMDNGSDNMNVDVIWPVHSEYGNAATPLSLTIYLFSS